MVTARAKPGTARRVLDDAPLALWVHVDGTPVQQGSKYAPKAGVVGEAKGAALKAWRGLVGTKALQARNATGRFDVTGNPVRLNVAFRLGCPANKTPGALAPVVPDVDKLLRAVLDALTGVIYRDDRQVVAVTTSKRFTHPGEEHPGVAIGVEELPAVDPLPRQRAATPRRRQTTWLPTSRAAGADGPMYETRETT